MRVPGDLCPWPQARVGGRKEVGGEARGDGFIEGVVEEEGEKDFVYVRWELVQGEMSCEGGS